MFRNKAKHEASNKAVFFLLFGVALSTVLLAGALSLSSVYRGSEEMPARAGESDLAHLLPAGWVIVAGSAVSFDDLVLPAVVFATSKDGVGGLALAVWDRELRDYRLASQVDLTEVDTRLLPDPELASVKFGDGDAQILRVTASLRDQDARGIFFVVRDGERLSVARMRTGTGEISPALFIDGFIPFGNSRVTFQDVNGDGHDEVVVTRYSIGGVGQDASGGRSAGVYQWSGGMLAYDNELSWAMTKSAQVFPEPPEQQ